MEHVYHELLQLNCLLAPHNPYKYRYNRVLLIIRSETRVCVCVCVFIANKMMPIMRSLAFQALKFLLLGGFLYCQASVQHHTFVVSTTCSYFYVFLHAIMYL